MLSLDDIKAKPIPTHVAIIMDGNGRWAQKQGKDRIYGHHQGVDSVRNVLEACGEIGVKYLTVYAFSTENWKREAQEVEALMSLFIHVCHTELNNILANNIKVQAIGDIGRLNEECQQGLYQLMEKTKNNTALTFVIAISYGSRWEISRAARLIAEKVKNNQLDVSDIDEDIFDEYLQTKQLGIPDPDLLIRTSNEYRLSNYLLWQLAYTELYFTDVLWPDFTKEELLKAIDDFQHRTRRFGKTNEQIEEKLK